jgi:hypothetical protein
MLLKDVVKTAEKNKEIKKFKAEKYFLNSAMSVLEPGKEEMERWTLTYYNEKENSVVQVFVSEAELELKPPATPMNPTKQPLMMKRIKTNPEKVIQKAKEEFQKYKQPLSQIILSIQNDDGEVWRIGFVTKLLTVVLVRIDAQTGKILSSEMHSLTKQGEA